VPVPVPTIGVLALQGDVREHVRALQRLGADASGVRRSDELARCHGLVIPGGESTTIAKLATAFDLMGPLRDRVTAWLPVLGTCAGMILLAERIEDGTADQETIGGLDITVRRNAFGRQVDSFETELDMVGLDEPVHAVFIRAPWVEQAGAGVDVLARVPAGDHPAAGRIVAVRQGPLIATSFHPEFGGGDRIHAMFVETVRSSRRA
jgi:5'-phosphate synthase pdxT subunit